jgi:hypothetical protein
MGGKITSHNISAIAKPLEEISVGLQDLRLPGQGMFMSLFPWLWHPLSFSQNTNNLEDHKVSWLHI